MEEFGFIRVAAASPAIRLADPNYNAQAVIELCSRAEKEGVAVLVFPELCLTGYTCNDLFHHQKLRQGALEALQKILLFSQDGFTGLIVVGLPIVIDDQLFNCAAILQSGHLLGIVPKTFLPNYKEFYDARFFTSAHRLRSQQVLLFGKSTPVGTDLLFGNIRSGAVVGVEICEDLWVPVPPSSLQATQGANLLLNLSASNETIGKVAYRRTLVESQSARCIAGYIYASSGTGESTTDLVFGGHCLIAENGSFLAESQRFSKADHLVISDIDLDRLQFNRMQTTSFGDQFSDVAWTKKFRFVDFEIAERSKHRNLLRFLDPHPFVPSAQDQLKERCEEIFHIQTAGLGRRLEQTKFPRTAIGVSGGLDSTLALLVLCKTLDQCEQKRTSIRALTMPGFGTSSRTKNNAIRLMQSLGVTHEEIDIREICLAEMKLLGQKPFGIDLEGLNVGQFVEKLKTLPPEKNSDVGFENVQARVRTNLLMNSGMVVGTGDLSELALGWCTYNADHMSMYNVNVSVPKTLVKFLVKWAAENEFSGEARNILLDIVDTEISPELLPLGPEGKIQLTESVVGPYELVDFFLYHFLRFGCSPRKILFLASQTSFDGQYSPEEIRKWLKIFISRFFNNQFKRSCLPDGPKVGSVSLSPRGDWRMPSDASADLWLLELE
ncbi:NAD(+) synthase [Telmatocola sphagniphila]|uniref:Glutamine-dependent NAD(+) synthetase n=1 Tax=Telmatocola sphagniphila TaxID=1123043 RepID=A0A8E6BBG2_9BACT|nr:NAD(+) synthase [Telmatocola sphagniphila]